MRYLTVRQYAKKHNVTERAVTHHLGRMRIEGAEKCIIAGRPMWAIPESAPYPQNARDLTDDYDITQEVIKSLERRNKKK
jgi:hypothetical protein